MESLSDWVIEPLMDWVIESLGDLAIKSALSFHGSMTR
jgi:hypothetical protein